MKELPTSARLSRSASVNTAMADRIPPEGSIRPPVISTSRSTQITLSYSSTAIWEYNQRHMNGRTYATLASYHSVFRNRGGLSPELREFINGQWPISLPEHRDNSFLRSERTIPESLIRRSMQIDMLDDPWWSPNDGSRWLPPGIHLTSMTPGGGIMQRIPSLYFDGSRP